MNHTFYRERVSKINLGPLLSYATGWTARIWRQEEIGNPHLFVPGRTLPDDDVLKIISRFVQMAVPPVELAVAILALDRVNAVEIVDVSGFGEVLKKNWPCG